MIKLFIHCLTPTILFSLMGMFLSPINVRADEINDYQRDVDLYRTAYSAYEIKKSEYIQSGTFAAEEELVEAAQEMLLTRDDTWISYWQVLLSKLNRLKALSNEVKQSRSKSLQAEIEWLNEHKKRVVVTKTRNGLLSIAQEVNQKSETYGPLSFSLNSEITISSLIQTTMTLLDLNQELTHRAQSQQLETSLKEVKLRGLAVNKDRLSAALNRLNVINQKLTDSSGYGNAEMFNRILEEANPVFSEISELYQVLSELSRGLEW